MLYLLFLFSEIPTNLMNKTDVCNIPWTDVNKKDTGLDGRCLVLLRCVYYLLK